MYPLVHAELLALRTTRAPLALVSGAILLTAVLAVTPVIEAGKAGNPSIGTAGALLAVLGASGRGCVAALLLGVLTVTAEFRYHTVTATFLRTPLRARLLAAKAAAATLLGTVVAVGNLLVVLAIGLPTGAVQPGMLNPDILLREAGLLVIYQPVAVVLPIAWVLFAEDLLLHLLPQAAAPWSLGGVTAALANSGDYPRVLTMPVGAAALLGYALLLIVLGAARVVHRDIT
jgi:hypothetical protein